MKDVIQICIISLLIKYYDGILFTLFFIVTMCNFCLPKRCKLMNKIGSNMVSVHRKALNSRTE